MDVDRSFVILFLIIIPMVMSLVVGTDANPGGLIDNIRKLSIMASAYYLLQGYTRGQDRSKTAVSSRSMIQDSMNNQSLNQSTGMALIHTNAQPLVASTLMAIGHQEWSEVNFPARSRMR